MTTTIPENTIIRLIFHGEKEYWRICRTKRNADGTVYGGCRGCVPSPIDDFSLQFIDPDTLSKSDRKNAVRAFWTEMGTTIKACKQ